MARLFVFPSALICMLTMEWFAFVQSGFLGKLMDATLWAAVAGVQDAATSLGPIAYFIGIGTIGAGALLVAAVVVLLISIAVLMAKIAAETLP